MQINNFSFEQLQNSIFPQFVNESVRQILEEQSQHAEVIILNNNDIEIYQVRESRIKNFSHISFDQEGVQLNISTACSNHIVPFIVILTNREHGKLSIFLDEGSEAEILYLQNVQSLSRSEHKIYLEKNARLKSVWGLINLTDSTHQISSSAEIHKTDSHSTSSVESTHIIRNVSLAENAFFDDCQVFTPQSNIDIRSNISFMGQHACAKSAGCFISDRGEFFYEPIQEHFAGSSKSNLNFNVVLSNRAKSFFRGLVVLHKDAQKSEAYQQNKNLLLSRNARADSEPRLEIAPNDVFCKHGSATAELDKRQISYLMSRGFSYDQARNMIIQSFCNTSFANAVNQMPFDVIKDLLRTHYLNTQVGILNT